MQNPWPTTCPRCGRESSLNLVAGPHVGKQLRDYNAWFSAACLYICPTCRGFCLRIAAAEQSDGSGNSIDIERFPFGTAKGLDGLPEEVAADRGEAWSGFHGSLNKAAALLARSALETAVKNLGAAGKDLYVKIDNLAEAGRITNDLAQWAHEVRITGNEAAHEMGPVSEEDAKDGLFFLDAFLEAVYSVPARHQARRAAREGST